MRTSIITIVGSLLFFTNLGFAQSGCTDPQANNYNAAATVNNGSCTYPVTHLYPSLKGAFSSSIPESSGLVWTDGALWTHNDSGNPAQIFKVDTATGATLQTVYIDNCPNNDWEDIAADSAYIYIGDFGNNDGVRTNLKILKVLKTDIGSGATVHVNAQSINFSYTDQTSFVVSSTHNFDCESLISIDTNLYIFTKDRGDGQTRVYKLSKTPGTYTVSPYTSFNTGGLVTGADYDPIKKEVVLVGYLKGHTNSFLWFLNNYRQDSFFTGNKRRIELGNGSEWQTEGVAYRSSGKLWVSCESAGNYNASLFSTEKGMYQVTSTENVIRDPNFEVYPNPTSGMLKVASQNTVKEVNIYTLEGKSIKTLMPNEKEVIIDTKAVGLAPATYLIEVTTKEGTTSRMIEVR